VLLFVEETGETKAIIKDDHEGKFAAEMVRRWNAYPDLVNQLQEYHKALDTLAAMLIQRDKEFFLSESGQPWEAMKNGHKLMESLKS
jgi:hypothetical protein